MPTHTHTQLTQHHTSPGLPYLRFHVDRLGVPPDLRPAAPPRVPAAADASVAIFVVDVVGVASRHGYPRVLRLRAVGPGPEVGAVGGLGVAVDDPGGGVAELVQERL